MSLYEDNADGATPVPTGATPTAVRGRLYVTADCTADVTFLNGVERTSFKLIKGCLPFLVKSIKNCSLADTVWIATQSRI